MNKNKNQTLVGKGNLEGSVLQGVWMAVSGGGHDWVISWGKKKKKNVTQLHDMSEYQNKPGEPCGRCEQPCKNIPLESHPHSWHPQIP